jgi:prepilin-type N-terminal cleavage/methylation domain-containing protein
MFRSCRRSTSQAAFTLVEMLVVIGIIAVLAALLLPAVMSAINRARNTVIALEVKQLDTAIEGYRLEKGDYPPNFRDPAVVRRHISKCYPRIDPTYFTAFMARAADQSKPTFIDEGESLVFWLSMTDINPQYPFLSYYNPSLATANPTAPSTKKYYDFDQTRLAALNTLEQESSSGTVITNDVQAYVAKFAKGTHYIYIDSRSYADTCRFTNSPYGETRDTYAYAEDDTDGVRPYWSATKDASNSSTSAPFRRQFKPVNQTTFQIVCAGQDGDFGARATDVKFFPSGDNYDKPADYDNITSFSGGRTLGDSIP